MNHEAEYVSHELQLFWDLSESVSFTSGIFFYDATIDQRYDFFTSTGAPQYTDPTWTLDSILATVAPGAVPGDPPLTFLFTQTGFPPAPIDVNFAEELAHANGLGNNQMQLATGPWLGDASLGVIPHGIASLGSDIHTLNKTEREAFAAYTQGVWDINELFTLTAGIRYAYDDIEGKENLSRYAESQALWSAPGAPFFGLLNLAIVNILRGAINPATLQPTGLVEPWLQGVPITFGLHRHLQRKDEKITWRLNLDYSVTDDSMLYANATTGYRSGGFNLAFFSQTPEFEPEELIAYELGYKAQFMDNTLQFNASVYVYDYDTIHTRTEEACPPTLTLQSAQSACLVVDSTTSIQAAPGADVTGFEFEVLWLASDNLTIGGNFSYTDSEYSESFFVVDGADPRFPGAVYDSANEQDRRIDVKGNRLLQVPESKANAYLTYRFPLGDSGNLDVLGSWSYIDDVYFSAFETKLDLAPAYERLDLRATWTSPSESWIVSAFVNNLLDEIGIRQILRNGSSEGYRRTAQVTEPRVYGIELSYTMR